MYAQMRYSGIMEAASEADGWLSMYDASSYGYDPGAESRMEMELKRRRAKNRAMQVAQRSGGTVPQAILNKF